MDEATTTDDIATNTIIQQIIQSKNHECTTITIAHIFPTVIDSDKVLVLSDGMFVCYVSGIFF